ncbi:MAG TPA: hypothetical protein VF783_14105 [Terriglobales bacterium]
MTSQAEFSVTTPSANGNAVAGYVPMSLDGAGTPQAVSQGNPLPVFDAYVAPQVVTWTSATALNTAVAMNTAGMDSVAVTIQPSGTFTAGAITFEVYDGANWVPIKCARESSYNTDSTYSLISASSIQGWTVPVAGFPQFRYRLSTALTGTSPQALVTSIVSSAPDVSVVTAGLDPQQALHPGALTLQAQQFLAVGAASAQSAVVQAATNRVVLSSTTACWVAFGANPTASAAAGSIYVPANFPMPPIAVTGGTTKIAVIQASAAGSLSIIESV